MIPDRFAAVSSVADRLSALTDTISSLPGVLAIALCGGTRAVREAGAGDIDLCVYSTGIPPAALREQALLSAGFTDGLRTGCLSEGHFGTSDYLVLDGVDTWLMYFDVDKARFELDNILEARVTCRQDNYFYPTGRLAMYQHIGVLYDPKSILSGFRDKVAVFPDVLRQAVLAQSLGFLSDSEDLERAVARCDVLFYHFALDLAIDHMLQALFALNRVYMPGRKRSLEYISQFSLKPVDTESRLLHVILLGSEEATLAASYAAWDSLRADVLRLHP